MNPPRTFLFDVGKVLLDFDFEGSLQNLLPPDTPDADERIAKVMEPKDPFERGQIPLEEYLQHALQALGDEVTEEAFLDAWRQIFTPNLPMWEAVKKLKSDGHRLLLFSNTNAIHCPWFLENFEIFELFEGGTYSFEAGSMKPEPAIYEAAINTHGLTAKETLYIDDLPDNIDSGIAHGFRSHQYDLANHAAFEQWLRQELEV